MPSVAATRAIRLSRKHIGNGAVMESSARLCLADAIELFDNAQDYESSFKRAMDSLRYSVGVFHEDYRKAKGV